MENVQSKEKAEEEQMVTIPAEAFGSVGNCWTIDSTTNDNGFLPCARSGLPGAGSHGSTNQAVNNLLGCLPSSLTLEIASSQNTANIVGHGNDGFIVTGTGQACCTEGKYIGWWNNNSWTADIRRLNGKVSIVKLWTCHAGTGQSGVTFLDRLSQATGAICMAPTGFTYCSGGNFSLEAGSTWQVVVPGQPLPAPINAPTPHLAKMVVDTMKISIEKGYENIPLENIDTVEISGSDKQRVKILRDENAKDILRVINFDSPFVIEGVPAAIITGYIRVHFKEPIASRTGETRDFIIWNDRQLEDAKKRGHFYNVVGDLHSLMRMML